jgi:hypothetical protein
MGERFWGVDNVITVAGPATPKDLEETCKVSATEQGPGTVTTLRKKRVFSCFVQAAGLIGIAEELSEEEIEQGKEAWMLLFDQVAWDSYTTFRGYTSSGPVPVNMLAYHSLYG